jgi:hypothetical protein
LLFFVCSTLVVLVLVWTCADTVMLYFRGSIYRKQKKLRGSLQHYGIFYYQRVCVWVSECERESEVSVGNFNLRYDDDICWFIVKILIFFKYSLLCSLVPFFSFFPSWMMRMLAGNKFGNGYWTKTMKQSKKNGSVVSWYSMFRYFHLRIRCIAHEFM